ncbi:LysE family translocator [Listeria aquatica]|uniref:LysE family translocator n=1 Tax=Listeria aquatica TaxID=1494960 RepID=UPI003F7043BA
MINYYGFLFLVIMLILVPGPDYIIITKNTIASGGRSGFQTVLGTVSALFCHTVFAVVGLSALIVKSALLFNGLKYIGAIYLIYLGIKSVFLKESLMRANDKASETRNAYKQGLVTNLFNPKVAVFFLTFLPQFIEEGNTSFLPFAELGLTYVVLTLVIYCVYVQFLAKIRRFMESPRVQKTINKISGVILIAFGIKLITEKA